MSRNEETRGARATIRTLLAAFLTLLAAACGGGGSGGNTLYITFSYGGAASLFHPSAIVPTITGLEGHSPNCSLVSGTLPPGMTLGSDCVVSGTPTQAGTFQVVVHLSASGVSNTLDLNVGLLVTGPSVVYSLPFIVAPGASVDVSTLNNFWAPNAADAVTYSVTGSFPPGLVIDAVTGRIYGSPTTPGTYNFSITATVNNAGRLAVVTQPYPLSLQVTAPAISYGSVSGWIGLPYSSTPTLPPGGISYIFSALSLPPGLSINPTTGVIFGTPTAAATGPYPVQVSVPGGTLVATVESNLFVQSPVNVEYVYAPSPVNTPYSAFPTITNNSGDPLPGISYSYSLAAGSTLHPGISLNTVTGEISGATATNGPRSITIDISVTFNGATFTLPSSTFTLNFY